MPDQPDYFERLLATCLPDAAGLGDGGAARRFARVRPRLPGPFERAEGRWSEPADEDAPAPLVPPAWPSAPQAQPAVAPSFRTEPAELRTAPPVTRGRDVPPPATARPVAAPSLRPAADVSPPPVAAAEAAMAPGRQAGPLPGPAAAAHSDPDRAGRSPLAPVAASPAGPARLAPPVPRLVPPAGARPAAEPRQAPRPARPEPAVQVRIGRLEVRAAEPARRTARPARDGRRPPAVDLPGYLSDRRGAAS
jgi:hypothetical protein